MSVFMIMRVKSDPSALEKFGQANAEVMMRVAEDGKAAGAMRHAFAAGDGETLVIDEWPDEASFQRFFSSQTEIPRIMKEAGAQGEPQISFYRKMNMPDEF